VFVVGVHSLNILDTTKAAGKKFRSVFASLAKMSNTQFVKGACTHCAGHLEFPATAAGSSVNCPHCGQPTELMAPAAPAASGNKRVFIMAIVAMVVSGILFAGFTFFKKPAGGIALPATLADAAPKPIPASEPDAVSTNDFAVATFALDKKPGSSLVYVTGKLRNLANRQRFGVKLEFTLFDRNDLPIGTAKDYIQLLEPHGVWQFQAMVLESKVASARFGSLHEDQ
jgi:hypothetical protein